MSASQVAIISVLRSTVFSLLIYYVIIGFVQPLSLAIFSLLALLNCLRPFLQGRFEILSLSGSFMPTETGGTRSRSGGMSVSLASPDGRVVGGGVAGLLVAASPVQVCLLFLQI